MILEGHLVLNNAIVNHSLLMHSDLYRVLNQYFISCLKALQIKNKRHVEADGTNAERERQRELPKTAAGFF